MDREIPPRTRRLRTARRLGVAVLLLAASWGLLAWAAEWLRPSLEREQLRTGVVDRGPLEEVIEASGVVVPASERVIASPVASRIVRVLRRPGERVDAGDAVLELDLSEALLERERLDEQLARALNERGQVQLELDESLAERRGAIRSARLDLEIQRYRLARREELHRSGLLAEEALREAEVEVGKAEIELALLEESVEAARRTASARLDGLDLQVGILRREVAEATRRIERATTRAEAAGVVTWVLDRPGRAVAPGEELARVADLGAFRVEASVSDIHAARLAPGLPVRVRLPDGELVGRVGRVHPTMEGGAARFEVELDRPSDPRLRGQLRVDVDVVEAVRDDVLRLPKGPFVQAGRLQQVFVLEGSTARREQVRIGASGRDAFEVLEGLRAGEVVILSDLRDHLHRRELEID